MSQIDKKIEQLILDGFLEIAGVDTESGDILYNFTTKLQQDNQELYNIHNNYFFQELNNLWQKGFINMSLLDFDPEVTLTEKAHNDQEISKLSKEERHSLNEIKRITGDQK